MRRCAVTGVGCEGVEGERKPEEGEDNRTV